MSGVASKELFALAELCKKENATYGMLSDSLGGRTHAFFALIAAVPFLTPLPLPGLSIAFGMYETLVGLRIAAGKGPWVPSRWHNRPAPGAKLGPVFSSAAKILVRAEGLIKQRRFLPFSTNRVGGALIAISGVLLALPFPPGTNFPPAWSILFLSLGITEDDDLCWLIGALALLLTLAFFTGLVMLGAGGVRTLLG